MKSCETCRFSDLAMLVNEGPVTECHRFPPMTVPPFEQPEPFIDEDGEQYEYEVHEPHRWPVVRPTDWCGEWKPK